MKSDQEYKDTTTKQLFADILDKARKRYEDGDPAPPVITESPKTPQSPYCRTRGRPRGSKQKLKMKAKSVSVKKKTLAVEAKKDIADLYAFESEPSSPVSVEDTFDLISSTSPGAVP